MTSQDSCTATDEVTVLVDRRRKVYVPNAFSPNGDGTNDELVLHPGKAVSRLKNFAVYDRWGGLSYRVTDIDLPQISSNGWDGKINGQAVNPGIYIWKAEVEFIDGATALFQGSVVLIE